MIAKFGQMRFYHRLDAFTPPIRNLGILSDNVHERIFAMFKSSLVVMLIVMALPLYAQTPKPANTPEPVAVAPARPLVVIPTQEITTTAVTNFKDLFAGKIAPTTMVLKNMDSSWTHFNISTPQDSQIGSMLSSVLGGMTSGYYSKGEIITLNSVPYLIAYALPERKFTQEDLRQSTPPPPVKVTPDTELHLCLLNLYSAISILNIRPFDLSKEISSVSQPTAVQSQPQPESPIATPTETRVEPEMNQSSYAKSVDNLKQLGLATLMYVQDYNETFPPMQSFEEIKKLLMPYVKNESVFYLPGTKTPYSFNPLLNKHRFLTIPMPAKLVLFYEPHPRPDGSVAAVFADGHVTVLTRSEWVKAKRASKIKG